MNASSSSDDDDAPGASTWEGEDETSWEATGDSDAAGKRALRVEAAATKRLSLSERLRRLDAAAAATPPQPPRGVKTKRRRRDAAGLAAAAPRRYLPLLGGSAAAAIRPAKTKVCLASASTRRQFVNVPVRAW